MTPKQLEAIVDRRVKQQVQELLRDYTLIPKDKYPLTAEEKAKQLHISVSRLYKIKDTLSYHKEPGRRRLMFQ